MIKTDIDTYLSELGKSLKKKWRGTGYQLELIIVGGASIILNYNFRKSTIDIDAYNDRLSSIKESVNEIRDRFDLPDNWLNSDFQYTSSFSEQLRRYSKYYKTYGNTLIVYTVNEEYLLCMKLVAFRPDRHDIDDILGIMDNSPNGITLEKIDRAMNDLYGGWNLVSEEARLFINQLLHSADKS